MKKLLLTSVLSMSAVFAASDADILGLYDQDMMAAHGLKMEIAERKALDDGSGFEMVTLKISQDGITQTDVVFVKDNFLVQDIINLKTKDSYKTKYQAQKVLEGVSKAYASEDAKNIIKIGNDSSKPTLLMLSDADCPYCRMEIGNLEDNLKTHNYEIIMTSIHGPESHAKSVKIYEEIAKAKDDNEKIKILKKYFDEKLPAVTDVDKAKVDKMQKLADKYFAAGVTGVPFVIDKKELIK